MIQKSLARYVNETLPERWPTLDEMPETDVSDIEEAFRLNQEEEQY